MGIIINLLICLFVLTMTSSNMFRHWRVSFHELSL